ncbi:MAG: hypothetical protein JNM34_11660 [Chthonomonadaceae bacterium]|nr:hypothetical protein [Chthonomonadaceae bacterium]
MRLVRFGLVVTAVLIIAGCASEDQASTAKELTKDMPKSTSNAPDLPNPGEGYKPEAGVPTQAGR